MNKKLKSIALRITKYKLYLYLKANNGVSRRNNKHKERKELTWNEFKKK